MKRAMISTKCPCGHTLDAVIAKPNRHESTVTKFVCDKCKSRFTVICKKISTDSYDFDLKVIELSTTAKRAVAIDIGKMSPGEMNS